MVLIRSLPEGKVVSPRWLSNKDKFFNFNNMDIVVLIIRFKHLSYYQTNVLKFYRQYANLLFDILTT